MQRLNKKTVEMKPNCNLRHYLKQYEKNVNAFSCFINVFKAYSLYGKSTGKRDELQGTHSFLMI